MNVSEALVAAGIVVHDARVAPRPGAWEPLAVMWHHTGTVNPPPPGTPASLRVCQEGRADLPGPLCQWLVGGEGEWWWVADGKTNHAGKGSRAVLNWVITQGQRPPDPPRPDPDDYDAANRFYVGVEVEGNGNWSPVVHRSMLTGTRVLLAHYGLPPDNVIAHREHTRRKIDPSGIDMSAARAALRAPIPVPQPEEEDVLIRFADKTGADQSQIMALDGRMYVVDEGPTAAALEAAGVKVIAIGATDYAQLKLKADA